MSWKMIFLSGLSLALVACSTEPKREPAGLRSWYRSLVAFFWSAPQLPKGVTVDYVKRGDAEYEVISVDPSLIEIKMRSFSSSGSQLKHLKDLQTAVEKENQRLVFAVNGGMYNKDLTPVGLYIENSTILNPLNIADGEGNFFLKPNGVFALTQGGPKVLQSSDWSSVPLATVRFATQSGPMLLINGEVHPAFRRESPNLNIRSGVGVSADGHVHFVLSKDAVRFFDLASFFRENLKCANALYIDGAISKSTVQDRTSADDRQDLGTFIYATSPAR